MGFFSAYAVALVPLAIAMDPAGVVVVFLGLTEGMDAQARMRIIRDALITAVLLGVIFMFLGAAVFSLLGIDRVDFQIGGGIILLVLSLADLVVGDRTLRRRDEFIGVVPLGTPLIVGPAVLTAITVLMGTSGPAVTMAAFLSVILMVALALALGGVIARAIGTGGLRALSKIISILLAGFAVHLIRVGVVEILGEAVRQ